MRIYTPEGTIGIEPLLLAPLRPVLSGARIGILDNSKPNAGILLGRIAERISQRTGARISLIETKNAAIAAPSATIEKLIEKADIVLTGSAD